MTRADDTHEVYKTADNTPRSSRERETSDSVLAIVDNNNNEQHGTKYYQTAHNYGHGAFISILVLQVIIVCVLEGLEIQQAMTGMSNDCTMTLDVIGISQVGFVYRGLVMAATFYQLMFGLDTIQQQSTIHLCMLFINGLLFIIFVGIQITQNSKWETTMQEMGCGTASLSHPHYDYALLAVVAFLYLVLVGCGLWMRRSTMTAAAGGGGGGGDAKNKKIKETIASMKLMAFIKLAVYYLHCYAVQLIPAMVLDGDEGYMVPVELVLVPVLGTLMLSMTWYSAQNKKPWLLVTLALLIGLSLGYVGYRTATFAQPHPVDNDPYHVTRQSLLFTTLTLFLLMLLSMGVILVLVRCLLRGTTLF